jgi:hypothetical protein
VFQQYQKKKRKENNLLCFCFFFFVFLVAWQVMTKEIGEIVFEMKENRSSPMRIMDQIFVM